MYSTFAEHIAVRQVENDVFESILLPHRMGNVMPIAYGGNTLAVALNAAAQSIPSNLKPYSAMGYFLGPAQIDRPFRCRVYRTRDTRSFATRRVVVEQKLDDGKDRSCMEIFVDFQAEENPLLKYSAVPTRQYSSVENSYGYEEGFKRLIDRGDLPAGAWKQFQTVFGAGLAFLEQRQCPEGVSAQNMNGSSKHVQTDQDHLPITEKTSAEYIRTRQALPASDQLGALAYILDGALSFTPLIHDHKFLDDAGACSSLDFALRIFTPTIKLDDWHLRERRTIVANAGRTYSEGRFWNANGELIASMTQQSILRPKPPKKAVL